MEKEFVPYDIALAMKELEFDEPCVGTYHDNGTPEKRGSFTFGMFQYPKRNSQSNTVEGTFIGKEGCYAPLYQQAFRWFREQHELYVEINPKRSYPDNFINGLEFHYEVFDNSNLELAFDDGVYSYEEAQNACLRKLIEIVKKNQDENN